MNVRAAEVMGVEELLKIYRREEKFLVLNPLVPSWIVTNLNGALLIKIFSETLSTQETIRTVSRRTNISAQSVIDFLDAAKREGLSDVLILDEPDNNLDAAAVETLTKKIVACRAQRITLIISHDERLIALADEVLTLPNNFFVDKRGDL